MSEWTRRTSTRTDGAIRLRRTDPNGLRHEAFERLREQLCPESVSPTEPGDA